MQPTTNNVDNRKLSRRRNRLDPIYLLLDFIIFEPLFRPRKRNEPGAYERLTLADIDFLIENLKKHRVLLWLNVGLVIYLAAFGLDAILKNGDQAIVVTGLLAPAVITGAAWYAVSFGGIPEKFIGTALILTSLMFLSFSLSMTLLIALLCKLTPWPIACFILVPIYLTLYVASMLYDNLDGLKIGLDTTLLKFSRASLAYYQKHGYVTGRETESDVYEGTDVHIPMFTHYLTMLERNVSQLSDRDQSLPIANKLLATSTELLFSIIDMSLPKGAAEIDKGNPEKYERYLKEAHEMSQDEVDNQTIEYLKLAIQGLEGVLGPVASHELKDARHKLNEFDRLRKEWQGSDGGGPEHSHEEERKKKQQLADHLFVEVFQRMFSLIGAHRHLLIQARSRAVA